MKDLTEVRYGLRLKGTKKILGYYIRSNSDADFCVPNSYVLCSSEDNLWLVSSPEQAEYVRNYSTEWYNAGYESPQNPFKPEELEVVKVSIIVSMTAINVSIPTFPEYIEKQYKEKDPNHYEYVMSRYNEALDKSKFRYSLYDLSRLLDKECRADF